MERGAKPAKARVEARPSVTRKSRKIAGSTAGQLERRLTEAMEQQVATSEILHAISSSPTELEPVFRMILANAIRLCGASVATLWLFDGELLRSVAHQNASPEFAEYLTRVRIRPGRETTTRRAALERKTIHVADLLSDPGYSPPEFQRNEKVRTVLSVPLLRKHTLVGVVTLWRREVHPFTDRQVALVETFADQAVIAIENVRLLNETAEALEQQAAISEILQVISSSPGDVKPMLNAVAERALKLCNAIQSVILLVEGNALRLGARFGKQPTIDDDEFLPLNRGSVAGRAIIDRESIHMEDVGSAPEEEFPVAREMQRRLGHHAILAVPLMREDCAIGAIALWRMEARRFTDEQVALVKTFAGQAAIAIENVRLFNETKEALEQQTATSEILGVISQSPRDAQPAFDAIAAAALKLCNASSSNVVTYDGEWARVASQAIVDDEAAAAVRGLFPRRLDRGTAATRAMLTCDVVAVADVLQDPEISSRGSVQTAAGFRSVLAVPLIRAGRPIGAIAVGRAEPATFADKQVALLRTFADQAVIAIENARLFTELEARTRQLTQSVGELKALGDVGQVVSSTLDLETVLSTIVSRATALAGMDAGAIYEYAEAHEEFYLHTADRLPEELVTALRAEPIRKGEGALGRMAMTGEPAQIRDIMADANYQSRLREVVLRLGYRSLMAVPLMRDNHLLGGLVVYQKTPGEFDASVIDLLKTFATQSALAIQNARLFHEIEIKSRQLETASQHKSEFLANMSHELRTPLNAIIGFSEVLAERMFGEVNAKQAEYLSDILESGRHLLSLINDILDLSKIEAGRMELELSDFDLPSTIENTLTLVRERAARRAIMLARTIDERLGVIRGDERKVKQVLLNLLSNALKFTPEGGRIDVRAAVRDSTAEISVTDTGVGIAPEDQDTVFEEFRQVGTAAKKVEGTGLGLAISRKFIELHGGRIWVKSLVGVGSTFAFTLPLQ